MLEASRAGESLDPILFEVIRNGLTSVADEMGVALQRTAYSTNVKTRLDFSCAIFDHDGATIAQSFSIPIHLGSLSRYVPRILADFGVDRLRPGDALVANDGHRGGVHLNDVVVVAPVFAGDDLFGFVTTLAHHIDIGGASPGSMGLTKEVFQEGLIIPPTRLMSEGRLDEDIFRLLTSNVRSPRETGGDLRAQVAGTNIGIRRLLELVERFELQTVRSAFSELLDYTERRARAQVREIPDGVYAAEGFLDSDGISDEPIRIAVEVTVDDDRVSFDLSGSDEQCRGPMNATYAMTVSNCAYTLRALMDSDLPTNDGFYRVLDVIAPSGSIVNANHPAAISCGWETGFRVCETAFQALAQAVPERLTAGSKGCLCNVMFGGVDPRTGEYFAFFDSLAGGYGARATLDGMDAVQPHVQNTENSPVEETEANYPVRIERYELIPDSEGAGRQRGGLGLRRDYVFEGQVTLSVLADRAKFAPWGLEGGGEARTAHYVRDPEGSAEEYPSKFTLELRPGESFSVQMAGGGGYGEATERDREAVREDVRGEKITPERARSVYGIDMPESAS